MDVKTIIRDWLERNGYDGLYCDEVPCGCLKEGLAPCLVIHEDMDWSSCEPGYRREVSADEECGCDGSGTQHWHIGPEKSPLMRHLDDAKHWLCECGARCEPTTPAWRWNGREWEHQHGYPIGHVRTVRHELKPGA